MDDIKRGEVELSQFKDLSQEQNFGILDVQSLFKTVEDTLNTEFATLAKAFEAGLDEILDDAEATSEAKCTLIIGFADLSRPGFMLASFSFVGSH